jgi:hypothetical protein
VQRANEERQFTGCRRNDEVTAVIFFDDAGGDDLLDRECDRTLRSIRFGHVPACGVIVNGGVHPCMDWCIDLQSSICVCRGCVFDAVRHDWLEANEYALMGDWFSVVAIKHANLHGCGLRESDGADGGTQSNGGDSRGSGEFVLDQSYEGVEHVGVFQRVNNSAF